MYKHSKSAFQITWVACIHAHAGASWCVLLCEPSVCAGDAQQQQQAALAAGGRGLT